MSLSRRERTSAALGLLATFALGCGGGSGSAPAGAPVTATAWPEADVLFHREPRWLGADAAFSVPLGADRILWLFGDTFIATSPANLRAQSKMVRNSVAVQVGADPATAAITFHWGHASAAADAAPASFFADGDGTWSWPQHGRRLGDKLALFLSRVTATPGSGLGFAITGWRLALIDNPDDAPDQWTVRFVDAPPGPGGVVAGAAVLPDGEPVTALAVREPGDHAGMLVRWPASSLAAGQWDGGQWWLTDGRWADGGTPAVVLDDAGAECSLTWNAHRQQFVHVSSRGFGATTVAVRFAATPTGPWSAPVDVFRPPESDRADAFVYAAKGHPELGGADLVVTYVANTMGPFATLLGDPSIYFPRFVRLDLGGR